MSDSWPEAQQPPAERPKGYRRHGAQIALTAFVAFFLGAAVAPGAGGEEEAAAPIEAVTETITETVTEPAEVITEEAEPADLAERRAALDEQEATLAEREAALAEHEADLEGREAAASQAEELEARSTIGSGVWLVGSEIEPATYRTEGGGSCYWARLSGTGGELGDIIANGLPEGPGTVTIAPSDVAFETSGCDDWTRVG